MTATSLAELEAIRAECRTMVLRRAGWSGAAAVLPIPAADIGVDLGLFLNLIPAINRRFGLSPEQIDGLDPKAKELILLSLTSVGSQMVGNAHVEDCYRVARRAMEARASLPALAVGAA